MIFKVQLVYFLYLTHSALGHFKFTNVKCIEYDEKFVTVPLCELKMIQRDVVAFNLKFALHQLPVNNIKINMELLKKTNGYRPFFYNITEDFCKAMRYRKKMSLTQFVIKVFEKFSNANHTCPYDHDIVVKNLILRNEYFRLLPLPTGDYLLNVNVAVNNDWKVCVKVYVAVTE